MVEQRLRGLGDLVLELYGSNGSPVHAADRLVASGITSILNFAPVVLNVPREIEVRKVDLAVELQILSYYEQRKAGGAIHAVPGGSHRHLWRQGRTGITA